jgi:hypothetical protein
LVHLINSHLFGRRYRKKNKFLGGFVVLEKCEFGFIHAHLLLKPGNASSIFDYSKLEEKFYKALCYVSDKGNNNSRFFNIDNVDIRPISDQSGIASYVTKQIKHEKSFDQLIPLTKDGFDDLYLHDIFE